MNNDSAIALRDWLVREGWSGPDDIFLDLDPDRGIAAGQRWAKALEEAATRCEAVLFLASRQWLSSKWCGDEYQLANRLNKKLFALILDDIALDALPGGLTAQWQVVRLKGEPAERFVVDDPQTQVPSPVYFFDAGLRSLKRGLEKAGVGAQTFELQPDDNGPFGWRAPYRGLEALETDDAAVFFGRSADIVRGIDALRGLAARHPPRLLVVLGASGAGKSSFLRAGLWPRLNRDDSQWLPLKTIRAGRDGAIEGGEGLLTALEVVHKRFALRASRADLRQRLATPEMFIALLRELREAAAKRANISQPPYPLPVICLDQGEEFFRANAAAESGRLLQLARSAIVAGEALLLITIRSDAFGLMQGSNTLEGIERSLLSLDPVPSGEIAQIIREPSEVLKRRAGPAAPVFDTAVVERLQAEIAGEADALPLLAFVLQRLTREHAGTATIGLAELERTGGVAAAIEAAAEAALTDAGIAPERGQQREALRRLFIPHLARIDRESKAPQRRVAPQNELPADLAALAHALTARRLLVVKHAAQAEGATDAAEPTLEVAHEALLRQWPMLAELLTEDRDALLLLDGVLSAANDWDKADPARKVDFLAHRGSRLLDAQALSSRGADWNHAVAPARAYLVACAGRETAERQEREATLAREQQRLAEISAAQARTARLQRRGQAMLAAFAVLVMVGFGLGVWQFRSNLQRQAELDRGHVNLTAELATGARLRGDLVSALRLSVHAVRRGMALSELSTESLPAAALAASLWQTLWQKLISGHESLVKSAAFSPDGTRIVTASWDKTARIWDVATAKEIAVLSGHEGGVSSAAFSPDGTRIVTASLDKTARIWDVATAREIAVLRGHADYVSSAAFSPDGTRIVTASWDKTVRVWDVATAKEIAVLSGHEGGVSSAAFSPDGTRIVTASGDKTARIWDVATAREIAVLRGHEREVWSVGFSSDGTRIVTASWDKTVRVWDVATAKEIAVLSGHEGGVSSAAFSPDGTRIVTASGDKTARIWDVATAREIAVLRGHEREVWSVGFSPDGTRIVTASEDRTMRVWDVATAKEIAVLSGHEGGVSSAALSPDGTRIVTASDDKTAGIWDVATAREIAVLRGHEGGVWSAGFSPDGTRIVTASSDNTAGIWDVATAREIAVLRGHEDDVSSAGFSPDGTRIVTASDDKTARIWDVATAMEIAVLRGHADYVPSAGFSPDGTRIVTASWDKTARIWDVATAKEIAVLSGHEHFVRSAVFSPDGTRIVTASDDKTAGIWDVATAREIAVLRGHEGGVWSAGFSPDGTRIVTASSDNTAGIWDVATAREIAVLRGHKGGVSSAAFSPDGTRIVTASEDRTVRIWDVHLVTMSTKDMIDEVCLRRVRGLTKLTRDEMRLIGYPDSAEPIDVCAGVTDGN